MRRAIGLAVLVTLLTAGACGDDDDDGDQDAVELESATAEPTVESSEDPSDELTPSASEPTATVTEAEVEVSSDPGGIQLIPAFEGFERPVDLDPIPGDEGRYLAVEQNGIVLLLDEADSGARSTVADLTDRVRREGEEEGLLGLAFAPDFEESGRIYVYYSASEPTRTVLSRFSSDGETIDPSSEQVLYEVEQPFPNHNGGALQFGPDGMLYLGLGDGGSGGDPMGHGQDLSTALGSILRFDVSGDDAVAATDNPFVGNQDGALEETYAYGFRNPWRFTFDRDTGTLWVGDVGQSAWEEVDIVEAGGNYGWNITEGPDCYESGDCDRSGLIDPVVSYGHDQGCSISGGYVYRGEAAPMLRGWYVYADFCSGRIWATSSVDTGNTVVLQDGGPPISAFGESAGGELFALGFDGTIYRLEPA